MYDDAGTKVPNQFDKAKYQAFKTKHRINDEVTERIIRANPIKYACLKYWLEPLDQAQELGTV